MRRLVLGFGLVVGFLMLAAPAFAAPEQVGMVDTTKGEWHLRNPDGSERVFTYGIPGDIPLLGDWNCDGVDTPGAFRPSTGFFFFTNTNPQSGQVLVADITYFFGAPGDMPMVGDWDKDGCDSAAIYRNGTVYSRDKLSTGFANRAYFFGNPGDRPFATDWDGDGRDSVGIYRSSNGKTFYTNEVPWNGVAATANDLFFGITSDQFVPGDWDGNPTGTVGIYRPSDGNFYLRNTNTTGVADIVFGFGQPGWTPVAGDTRLRTATLSPSTTTLDLGAVGLNSEGAATVRLDFSGSASDADLRITSVEFGQNGFDYSASELANYDIGFGESRFLQIKLAPTTLGVKRGFVRIRHTGANSPLIVDLIGRASYRVNAGGDPIEDWGPDSPYGPGGSVGPLATTSVSGPTAPDEVFESYRFGQQSWDFPVTPGAYEVNLYFAETFPGTQSVGARQFDVDIEGIEVLDNFDIFAAAGANNGIVRSFDVVSNANLDIDLRSVVNSAAIQGIEIIPRPQWNSLGAAPSEVNFGSIAVGDTLTRTITIVHLGEPNTGSVNIPGASIIGANANQFAITSGAGGRSLTSGQSYTVTVEFRPTTAGVFDAELFISHSGVNSPLRVDLNAAADDVILYRLNAGGDSVVGQFSWSPDEQYLSPNSPTGEFAVVQAINTSDQSIPPGTPLDVLRTERFGSSSVPMRYDLPVPNGAYEVRLYFLEAVHNAAGIRVFDVNVEFGLAINDLDIWQRAGKNKAIMIPIQTTVSGGNLDIDLIPIPGKNLPAIHGIEVIRKEGNAFLDADPVSLTLGPIGTAGTTTATVDFEHNGGAGIPSIVVQNVAISGPGASRFTLLSGPQIGDVFPPGTSETASIRFTPGVIGDKSASLNVTYNGGRVVSVPLNGSVNNPPFIANPGTRNATEGTAFSVTVTATDPDTAADGDFRAMTATGVPSWATVTTGDGFLTIAGTPGFAASGTSTVTVTVTDPDGLTDSETFSIVVANFNRPPTFSQDIPNQTNSEGDAITLSSEATDLDGDDLTWSASGLPGGLTINPASGLISGTIGFGAGNPDPGVFEVLITVTDNGSPAKSDTDGFFWTVFDANQPPTFNQNLSNRTDNEGAVINLGSPATDPDDDGLTWSATGLPGGLTINPATGVISGTIGFGAGNPDPGVFSTVITVTDDGTPAESATDTFSWSVNNVNRAPTFSQDLPNRTDAEGEAISISSPATDPDGNGLTYSATGLPGGITINPATGLISGTIGFGAGNPDPGVFSVTVTVTDNGSPALNDTDGFFWTVNNTNLAPTANATAPATGDVGASVAFFGSGSDPDGTIASYSWNFGDGSPLSSAQNPSHVYSSGGTYNGSLIVIDNDGTPSAPDAFAIVISDTTAPSFAGTVTASAPTSTTIDLSWPVATDGGSGLA
ncbi:MAG: choice-of-anchor D domain-containing protein, partial [Acidimicrobiia bacterium]|nr:choice-of-anchor D domain-containing protein [Acidimicrobiia bacterium]